jgi:hypothetical protein
MTGAVIANPQPTYEIITAQFNEVGPHGPRFIKLSHDWLAQQRTLPKGKRALCINLDCNEEFSGDLLWNFVARLPTGRSGQAVGGCICPNCVTPENLQNLILAWVRQISPDARLAERQCLNCSLCCRVFEINEPSLRKPANTWCQHCQPGKGGCMIYDRRPEGCKKFRCGWLIGQLDDEWYPLKSKIVARSYIHSILHDPLLEFWVDPGYPNRWREEPYYSQIKHLSLVGLSLSKDTGYFTQVVVGPTIFMVFPAGEIARRVTISAEEKEKIAAKTLQIADDCMDQVERFCAYSNLKFSDSFMLTYVPPV